VGEDRQKVKALSGTSLGFPSLTRAMLTWSFLTIGLSVVIAILLGGGSQASQAVEEINGDPQVIVDLVYQLLSTVTVYSLLLVAYMFFAFVSTVSSSLKLLKGSRNVEKPAAARAAALLGSSASVFGSFMATLGYLVLLGFRFKPHLVGGIRASVVGPLVVLPVPLPWPLAIGLPLWLSGLFVDSLSLYFAFRAEGNGEGQRFSLLLAAGIALFIIPLLGSLISVIASKKLEAV